MRRTADRLLLDYRWSVLDAGRNQLPIGAMSVAMGGNVRVGLEDPLWAGAGKLATSNAEQVIQRARSPGLRLELATPDELARCFSSKEATKSQSDHGRARPAPIGQRQRPYELS